MGTDRYTPPSDEPWMRPVEELEEEANLSEEERHGVAPNEDTTVIPLPVGAGQTNLERPMPVVAVDALNPALLVDDGIEDEDEPAP